VRTYGWIVAWHRRRRHGETSILVGLGLVGARPLRILNTEDPPLVIARGATSLLPYMVFPAVLGAHRAGPQTSRAAAAARTLGAGPGAQSFLRDDALPLSRSGIVHGIGDGVHARGRRGSSHAGRCSGGTMDVADGWARSSTISCCHTLNWPAGRGPSARC